MARRFQFSLRTLLILMALVAIVAATLPTWLPRLWFAVFVVRVIVEGLFESFRDSPRETLMALLTLSIPATVVGVLSWALVLAVREKRRAR